MIGLKPVDYDSQETTINMLAAEPFATIYTCERSMLAKLSKLAEANQEIKQVWTDGYAVKYRVPKKWVAVKAPSKRNLTPEQRKELSERMKSFRSASK